jgi:hypothetical protein
MDTIMRSEVVRQIESGEPFTMEFVKADRRRGIAGELVKVENWIKKPGQPVEDTIPGKYTPKASKTKNPGHYTHGTFNVHNPGNKIQHIIKVHTVLIQTFNGKKVVNG